MLIAGFGRKGHAVGDIPGECVCVKVWDPWWVCMSISKSFFVFVHACVCDELITLPPLPFTGVRFKVVKVANVSLWALYTGKKERPRS